MDMLDQKNVMTKLNRKELQEINGGSTISGVFLNAITSGIKTILDVGRSLGTAIRRIKEGKLCSIS